MRQIARVIAAALALAMSGPAGAARQAQRGGDLEAAYRANNIGVAYLEQYNHEAAVKSFRRALEIEPSLTLAKINLAIGLFYVPDMEAAKAAAEQAAAAAPDAPQPHYILGLIAKAENRVDDAVAAFRKVLSIDPTDLGASVNLAQLYMQRREFDAAVELLRPAVALEPYHVTALYNLGVALTRAGKMEEGQKVMAQFQALREGGYGTTFSNNYMEQGRYAEALPSTGAEPDVARSAAPSFRFTPVTTLKPAAPAGGQQAWADQRGAPTLADLDRDGDLDLLVADGRTLRLYRNENGTLTDASDAFGVAALAPKGGALAAIVADYDNDDREDVFVLGAGSHLLLQQSAEGRLVDVGAKAGLPATSGVHRSAAFVDADHDGDVDLFLAAGEAPSTHVLLRNNGNGTFTDISADAKVAAVAAGAAAVVPTDFDNRRDVDLLLAGAPQRPVLLKNLRDGTFQDVAAELKLPENGPFSSVAAGDLNKDSFTDFVLGRPAGPASLVLSDGRGGFRASDLADLSAVTSLQVADVDNDGLLDIVAIDGSRLVVKRSLGSSGAGAAATLAWADAASVAPDAVDVEAIAGARAFASGDLDGDGDTDFAIPIRTGEVVVLRNETAPGHAAVAVRLEGRVSNRSAVGAKVEMRAGSLRQKLETASAWPAAAPADLTFGLGSRPAADVVRVLWPAGILQAEIPESDAAAGQARVTGRVQRVSLTELDRKPSSCPYLFTWNGERFEFITDFMGGGEMGYLHAPGVVNTPDPEEYTRIDGRQLQPRDGRYELRVTNELEEALFVDRLQLLVVDHPADVEVHPREGLFSPPFPSFELFAAARIRPVAHAIDHAGRDVTARVRALDRVFVDDLPLERIRGYARPHTLTLDLGDAQADGATHAGPSPRVASEPGLLLLLTGWTDYAFSSDNVAAHQAGLALTPPSLQVKDERGEWRTVVPEVGVPVGRPQTVVVDLAGKFLPASREVRIVTSMRIYWDQIRVATRVPISPRITRLDPIVANLRWRGFSAEATPDGREPHTYDYSRVSSTSPWKTMPGRYTREGDVRELLRETDDFFVVSRPGDEIALSFDASSLPPLAAGWTRTFLLHSVGYSKEMDRNSASPDQASPLPFRNMTRYPYEAPEKYPDTPAHREYLERWNTRIVGRPVPPLELAAAAHAGDTTSQP
ncbi:MAG TPA: FG-GAP-like repeat-containing protein [Vicinamibacterales bacterium]